MIKLFRHIRQQLILENKMGKYFKYAIGEIFLVVIGILIALQINNWNESRKDVQREIKMLMDIKNDINNNIANITEGVTILEEGIQLTTNILTAYKDKTSYDSTMVKDFLFFNYYWDPDFRYASFENLQKEGVNLISNDSLRDKIIEIFEIDMDILDVSDLNKHNDYMTSVGNMVINNHLYFDYGTGFILPINYQDMMSDSSFYSFASFHLSYQYQAWDKSKKFIEKSQLLDNAIGKEIKRLQNN
ncbi:DUF6090 family protein [Winogradskyella vincentii]|uniref:Uncharacterized protein n=1 Tax=Winogradskyella vincentii TaxID=2877122 RepID=A0ABS7Y3D3_9FLAO|nr:DUF6090 family protein [Winogradskyella vincentii]MCA0154421.1 hypothetical protein [Winogradskyella vincentii]